MLFPGEELHHLLGENSARHLLKSLEILTFQSIISPFICAISVKKLCYIERKSYFIIYKIFAENVNEKFTTGFKIIAIQKVTKMHGVVLGITYVFTQ